MTPLEKVAIAISGAPFPSPKSLAKARAALLALAEAELPEWDLDAGAEAMADNDAVIWPEDAQACFRAICRAIASEGGENDQDNRS